MQQRASAVECAGGAAVMPAGTAHPAGHSLGSAAPQRPRSSGAVQSDSSFLCCKAPCLVVSKEMSRTSAKTSAVWRPVSCMHLQANADNNSRTNNDISGIASTGRFDVLNGEEIEFA